MHTQNYKYRYFGVGESEEQYADAAAAMTQRSIHDTAAMIMLPHRDLYLAYNAIAGIHG